MITLPLTLVFLAILAALSASRGRFHVGTTALAVVTGVMLANTVIGADIVAVVSSAVHVFSA
jgi:hypothetical protein